MFKVILCVTTEHDLRLVVLAALVCLPATLATFFLYSRVPTFPKWRRLTWLAMTGLVAGSGIWTTHFVAMLAFKTGLPTGYDALETLGSLFVAIVSTAVGFAVGSVKTTDENRVPAAAVGGLIVGLGITFMHYVGMAGYRTAGYLLWDAPYILASVLIGAVFAAAALAAARPGARLSRQAGAAGLLSLGIVGMHFTGMTAVTIIPDPANVVPASLLADNVMAVLAVAVAAMIMITAIGGVAFDAASRNGGLRRLREALDALPEGLAFYDASDRLLAWNTRYEDLCRLSNVTPTFGMSFDELLDASLIHGAFPDAAGREVEWRSERMAARWGDVPNLTQQTTNGRWLRITERRTADGGTVSVSVDITDLKRAEADMAQARDKAEEQARRAEVAEAMARLGHWRLDTKTNEVTWSAQMYRIYDLPPEAPLDLDALMRMTHPEDAQASTSRLQQQISAPAENKGSITRIVRMDGEIRFLASNSRTETSPDGEIVGVIGTIVDITDQQRLEADLRQARMEAELAAAVKSEFLANMSHELRTPLTSIIGFTSLASEQSDLTPLTRDYVERVRNASRALLCTVNDILDFSKLEAGQVSFRPEPVSIGRLTRATLDLFTPQAGAKDLTLSLAGEPDDLVVSLDPDRIRQVLLNLVGNAVKFTPAGGVALSSTYDREQSRLRIAVADTGPGIAADMQDRLFKRFSQVDGSLTRANGGTGLGLAICKGLVEAMGGDIGVDSEPGRGTTFWFEIPAPLAEGAAVSSQRAAASTHSITGVRVLVVDDHFANRELARLFLAGVGAEVSEAQDGEEAVQMVSECPYDIILMDVRMPKLDGPGALQRIRASEGPNDNTPILAFSAEDDFGVAQRLLAMGFQDVVSKPVDSSTLIAAIARATSFDDAFPTEEIADVA